MKIYVETNFVLELVFQQEQYPSCEEVVHLGETGKAQIVIPAYCLAEPHEKLRRQSSNRKELQQMLDAELRQLARTAPYTSRINSIQDISSLLIKSNEEERQRFLLYRERLLRTAEIVPLTTEILTAALNYEAKYDLSPQDALVYASVIHHLHQYSPAESCFLNRNSRDFDNPDIVDELSKINCKMIPRFDDGLRLIQSRIEF
jgi:predicted nucleic acid-binding protein